MDNQWGISRNNKLPWHIEEETTFFLQTVTQAKNNLKNAYIVGRKSWESDSKQNRMDILKHCYVMCLSSQKKFTIPDAQRGNICDSFDHALNKITKMSSIIDNIYICGGYSIYKEAFDRGIVKKYILSFLPENYDCDLHLSFLKDQHNNIKKIDEIHPSTHFTVEFFEHYPNSYHMYHLSRFEKIRAGSIIGSFWISDTRAIHTPFQLKISLSQYVNFIIHYCFQFNRTRLTVLQTLKRTALAVSKCLRYIFPHSRVIVEFNYMGKSMMSDLALADIVKNETNNWGEVDVLMEEDDWNIAFLKIAPQKSLPEHFHLNMKEAECILSEHIYGSLEWGPYRKLQPGTTFEWKSGKRHRYDNSSKTQTAHILCINNCKFHIDHEVLTGKTSKPETSESLHEPICLVIGGNGGIGKIWVQAALDSGFIVLATSRDAKNICADQKKLFALSLDLNAFDEINFFCEHIQGLNIRHVIIASGVKQGKDISFGQNLFEKTLSINYLGPFYLIQQLIEKKILYHKDQSVIILSSCLHSPLSHFREVDWSVSSLDDIFFHEIHPYYNRHVAYYKSKFAIECFVNELSKRMPQFSALSINPGYFPQTNIFQNEKKEYREKKIAEQSDILPDSFIQYYKWFLTSPEVKSGVYYDLQNEKNVLLPVISRTIKEFPSKADLWDKTTQICLKCPTIRQKILGTVHGRLTICTINLCGIKRHARLTHLTKRIDWILQYMANHQPDIICFQEVSYTIWTQILTFCAQNYYTAAPDQYRWEKQPNDHVINVTLLKWKTNKQVELIKLPNPVSNLDYHCLFTSIVDICVANIHLQAGKINNSVRKLQLDFLKKNIFSALENHEAFILAGDFNHNFNQKIFTDPLRNTIEQEFTLMDSWDIIHPTKNGFTEDPTTNAMRKKVSKTKEKRRVDAIFCSPSIKVKPYNISLFANQSIFKLKSGNTVFPSDHYGITCTFLTG